MNSDVKSFLLGLSGVFSAYLLEWASSTDFGVWTPVVAAGVPVLLNAVRLRLKKRFPDEPEPPVRPDDARPFITGALLLAVLCVPACAEAQFQKSPDLTFQLKGTTEGQVGKKVRLYVDFEKLLPGVDAPEVVVEHEAIRQSNPAAKLETETADNGRVLLIWAPAGSYDIRSRATLRSDATVKFESVYRLVMQEAPVPKPLPPQPIPPEPAPGPDEEDGSSPQPEPKPGPAPEPPPPPKPDPIPAGEFGIAPKVAEIVSKIADPQRKQKQAELADAADALAAEIAAGTVTNVQDVLVRIGSKLKALGPEWSAAASQFSAALQLAFETNKAKLTYSATGKITAPSAWATLVRECGLGARRAQ